MSDEFKQKQFEYERLWDYFEYHAKQRIDTFRFFVTLAGLIITGSFYLLIHCFDPKMLSLPTLAAVFAGGIALIFLSIIFWLLDKRNYAMINLSRDLIIDYERNNNIVYDIFAQLQEHTKKESPIKFSTCFNLIFSFFGILGVIIFLISLYFIIQPTPNAVLKGLTIYLSLVLGFLL